LNRLNLVGMWRARFSDYQRGRPAHANVEGHVDESRYVDVRVPGEVHLDLMRHGIIPDVYVASNVLAARWVEEQIWSYRRTVDVPADAVAAGTRAWLVFDGLDLAADVVLNGRSIARHANSFLPLRVEVTGALRAGANTLTVHLDAGLYHVAEKPVHGWYHGNGKDQVLHKRHWLRKPQSQFSWDWSPRLINVGIQGGVRLEYTADPVRVDRFVPLATLSDDLRRGQVRGRLFVQNLTDKPIDNATLCLTLDGKRVQSTHALAPGEQVIETTIAIDHPKLWHPIGHGEQARYDVAASLDVARKTYDVAPKKVGFRHVRVCQDPHPVKGRHFHFVVNGVPVFCKGANLVPADLITVAIDRERYETLVDRAVEANFNTLRVWGGGLYEHDDLFDLCDARGIMVWQEFIFACGKYPNTDEDFARNVIAEATHQVRRLAHHPSLIAWCGNNENETMHWHWGPGESGTIAPDYALYHLTLPRVLSREHPDVYYQPSSPYSPDTIDPSADHAGDQHPWSIGFGDTDFRKYRVMECRFANEGGILGPVSLPTMLDCMRPEQRFVQSFDWQQHDNSVDSWQEQSTVDHQTQQWLGKDCRQMSIEQYVFWGGLVQAEGLRAYVDNFRSRMFTDSGSAIFWMYNDVWPATRSWTIVDHRLRRTPSFHPVRRAFAPVTVVVAERGDDVVVFGVNETHAPVSGSLRFGLFTTAGEYVLDQSIAKVELAPNASTPIARFPRSAWTDPSTQIAFATLADLSGKPIARNRLILPFFKDVVWATPDVKVELIDGVARFTSKAFAFNVCLDLSGDLTADNFFDVFPGQPHDVPWASPTPPRVLYVGNLAD
jgi:beta-mannosidase